MGGRVEGKIKKKSKKANVTSKFSQKRLLSRMGKKVKKGTMGPSTEFVTRSAVLKKLQVTLKDFRRLCILKGIYPRVPVKAPKGSDKIYYDIKDISYLSHEPLLGKFREFKAFMKKIRKAAGRNEFSEAQRRDRIKPVVVLDHLVKERYPRFIDALRDMDDALCMIHLFAAMPSLGRITAEKTSKCAELARHWQYIVAKSKTLRKVFVSVKGVYFQAELMGETITWLAPHEFTQVVPKEVDLRVMMTFLEFYEVFLKFVMYKLYNMQKLLYPPALDKDLDSSGCLLLAIRAEPLEAKRDQSVGAMAASDLTALRNVGGATENAGAATTDERKKNREPTAAKFSAEKSASLAAKLKSLGDSVSEKDQDEEYVELDDDQELGAQITGPLADAFAVIHGIDAQAMKDEGEDERRTFSSLSVEATGPDAEITKMFMGLKFFVNREVPLGWLQLCILSYGGLIGWEGPKSPFSVDDPSITHHVIDRPMQGLQSHAREYVQPQWVFDSINAQLLLPVQHYAPGKKLPPHLSPFVNDDKVGYLPKYREEIRKLQLAAGKVVPGAEGSQQVVKEKLEDDDEEEKVSDDDDENEEDEEEEEEEANRGEEKLRAIQNNKRGPKGIVFKPTDEKLTEDEEAMALSRNMMGKKAKRLYGRMQHGIAAKQEEVRTLAEKRRLLEASSSNTTAPVSDLSDGRRRKQAKRSHSASDAVTKFDSTKKRKSGQGAEKITSGKKSQKLGKGKK